MTEFAQYSCLILRMLPDEDKHYSVFIGGEYTLIFKQMTYYTLKKKLQSHTVHKLLGT